MSDSSAPDDYLRAARAALAQFPLSAAKLELISRSENVTFRVTRVEDGTPYVLRLHRPGYNTLQELESERAWGSALRSAGIHVQKPVLSHDGAHFVRVAVSGRGEHRYAGITSWFSGEPLGRVLTASADRELRLHSFYRIGEIASRIHNQSIAWVPPPGFARCRLDDDGLLGDDPRWGRFWEHSGLSAGERGLLLQARRRCRRVLQKLGTRHQNFSLIHADLHPGNIIVDDSDLGLIDFDDAAYGWHGYELACALLEYWGQADFAILRDALLAGYRQHRQLPQADEATLPYFLLVRAMSIIGWLHQRPEHASSGYFEQIKGKVLALCRELQENDQHATA